MALTKVEQARKEAEERYLDGVCTIECPNCGREAGRLCDRPGVWVCAERFQTWDPQRYPYWDWPL